MYWQQCNTTALDTTISKQPTRPCRIRLINTCTMLAVQVLQRQAAMGLARKAGTEEMLAELAIETGPGGGFRGRGGRGRGRFDLGKHQVLTGPLEIWGPVPIRVLMLRGPGPCKCAMSWINQGVHGGCPIQEDSSPQRSEGAVELG